MKERALEVLKHAASEFINRESNRSSMITVTNVSFEAHGNNALIFVSVFPEHNTQAATEFLNRNRDEFKRYLKAHTRLASIPRVRFVADPVVGGTIEEAM